LIRNKAHGQPRIEFGKISDVGILKRSYLRREAVKIKTDDMIFKKKLTLLQGMDAGARLVTVE